MLCRQEYERLAITMLCLFVYSCGNPKTIEPLDSGPKPTLTRLQAVRELGAASLPGKFTCYYSAGYEERAKELSKQIESAQRFYEDMLEIKAEFALAVLDRRDWERVAPEMPFGLPSVSPDPPVILLPATVDGVVVEGAKALRERASAATLAKIEAAGFDFDSGAEKLIDLIALHELGHVLTLAYGIRPPDHWSNEFLASYFAYAYLQLEDPRLATLFVAITHDLECRDGTRPKHTSLEDFDRLYSQVGPANYGWYQGEFLGRVEQVYQARKLGFLESVRSAYPKAKDKGDPPRAFLERLERICPGFVEWGEKLR